MRLSNLSIKKLVMHSIFPINEEGIKGPAKCYSSLTTLDYDAKQALQSRLISSLGEGSASISMDITSPTQNSLFSGLLNFLNVSHPNLSDTYTQEQINTHFIDLSKSMANALQESYNRRNIPGGIIIIFYGTVGTPSKRFISIIKAEKQDGFTVEELDDDIKIQLLTNLLLTKNQELYKIAFFLEKDWSIYDNLAEDHSNNFDILLYDKNLRKNSNAAEYFYKTFLGLSMKSDSKFLTTSFYKEAKEFINGSNVSNEQKVDYGDALYSYLKVATQSTINIREFAETYLPPNLIDSFVTTLKNKGIPERNIIKDTDGITRSLKSRNLKFSSLNGDVRIIAPADKFNELIQVKTAENGKTTIDILGTISQ